MAKSGLVARAKIVLLGIISALFYSDSVCQSPRLLSIFGIRIDNVTMAEAVDWITANDHVGPTQIGYFVNVNSVNIAYENSEFKAELAQADRVFADGSGVRLAVSKSGNRLKDNVNGTDLLPQLCKKLVKTGKSVYLLGAAPGVAEQAAKSLMLQFPGLNIAGCQHGYFSEDQNQDVIEHINASRADVLLVAFGSPKQEHWLASNRELLSIPCALAVGGLFDFFSGNVSRAPRWMRMIGFEWVWRLLQEPSRMWKRYILGNPLFLFRTFFMKKELMQ